MATPANVLKSLIDVNELIVENAEMSESSDGVKRLTVDVRPYKRLACCCPHCGRECPRYDNGNSSECRSWRALDCGGVMIYLRAHTHRISCPEHGVATAAVPWAFHDSGFTKDFDFTASWLATHLDKSSVSKYLRIDWKTVGRCITRTRNALEPNPHERLNGLVNIGVDETSYRKNHKYVTVVVNHDTNSVVWVHEGHGKEIFSKFFEELSEEERASIKTVSGDGAKWIDSCMQTYVPHAKRCTDPFHVVSWANEMLDQMRRMIWQQHRSEAAQEAKAAKNAEDAAEATEHEEQSRTYSELAKTVKGATYALGKDPDNLTNNQTATLALIQARAPKLFKAYQRKEELRAIFRLPSAEIAERELKRWYFAATHSRLPPLIELAKKVRRHQKGILNALKYRFNNGRIEANNNKIKLVIRRSFGFRNIESLMSMVMLVCSSIEIPLPNRPRQKALATT